MKNIIQQIAISIITWVILVYLLYIFILTPQQAEYTQDTKIVQDKVTPVLQEDIIQEDVTKDIGTEVKKSSVIVEYTEVTNDLMKYEDLTEEEKERLETKEK